MNNILSSITIVIPTYNEEKNIDRCLKSIFMQNYPEDDLIFIIETQDAKPIGAISLYRVDLSSMRAKFGRMIIGDIKSQKKGFAMDASKSLIRFAFSALNLRQFSLEVLRSNERAIKLYEKIGFRKVQATGDDHPTKSL